MNFGYNVSFLAIDKGFIEQFGPTGFAKNLFNLSFNFSYLQQGKLFNTIFLIIVSSIILLSYYFIFTFALLPKFNLNLLLLVFIYLLYCLADE
jgi:hypothetical protein